MGEVHRARDTKLDRNYDIFPTAIHLSQERESRRSVGAADHLILLKSGDTNFDEGGNGSDATWRPSG